MNLVLDLGNTLSKAALFRGNELVSFSSFETMRAVDLDKMLNENPGTETAILSSVTVHDPALEARLSALDRFIKLDHNTALPIRNLYQSPETLGKDRLAAAAGAFLLFPGKPVLSIDAGTCIKYDLVTAKGEYLGGSISPGIDIRFKALNQFTDKLPLLSYRPFDQLTGRNTDESILSGVLTGTAEEARGIVARYQHQYPGLMTVLTGGYMKFFEKIFNVSGTENSSIFADPFLVLKGLNSILSYNSNR